MYTHRNMYVYIYIYTHKYIHTYTHTVGALAMCVAGATRRRQEGGKARHWEGLLRILLRPSYY